MRVRRAKQRHVARKPVDAYSAKELHEALVTDAIKGIETPLPWAVAAFNRIGKVDGIGAEAAYQRVRGEVMAAGRAFMPGAPGLGQ